jgi:O-antigen/teichoic acid export membrane protein
VSKTIAKNSVYFLVTSLITAGSAFAILPHLSRTFNIHIYGELVLLFSILQIAVTVSEFAFSLTSVHHLTTSHPDESIRYFKVITVSRALTTGIAALLATAGATAMIRSLDMAAICSIPLAVLAAALLPNWYFISTGSAKEYTLITFVAKMPAVFAIFIFVDSTSTVSLILVCLYAPSAILGIILHWRLWKREALTSNASLFLPALHAIRDNAFVFVSLFAVNIYANMSLPLLAAFGKSESVALYSFSDKIISTVRMLLGPIYQASLPEVGRARVTNSRKPIWRAFIFLSAIALTSTIILKIYSIQILVWIFGDAARSADLVLQIMLIVPVLLVFSLTFVGLALLGNGMKRQWSILVSASSVVHLLVFFILLRFNLSAEISMAVALVSCESLLAIFGIFILVKKYIDGSICYSWLNKFLYRWH